MNKNFPSVAKAFLPTALYFLLGWGLAAILKAYPVYGPTESGQPIFPSYVTVVHYSYVALIAISFSLSLVWARKLRGWYRHLTWAGLVLLLPAQYLFAFIAMIALFGK